MRFVSGLLTGTALLSCLSAHAEANYIRGRITAMTFAGADVLIKLDSGLPTNCIGTPYGWMVIPANAKATQAFVIALRFSGNMAETSAYVYTSGRDGSGYCQIVEIDPDE